MRKNVEGGTGPCIGAGANLRHQPRVDSKEERLAALMSTRREKNGIKKTKRTFKMPTLRAYSPLRTASPQ